MKSIIRRIALVALLSAGSLHAGQLPRSDLFTFHSDVFINLHHFLYRWAQVGPGAASPATAAAVALRVDDVERYRQMDATQQEAWDYAVAYYRVDMIDRDLLFDDEMVALRDCLVMAGNYCERIAARDQASLDVINDIMALYRSVFWNRHNAVNRAWIDDVMPLARRFENDIAPPLEAAYTGSWPQDRLRVDVTVYANRVGGYTTADGHITVSSIDRGSQGYLGLELLFHEASHADPLERPLRRLIARAFDAVEADVPPDLWHVTIFYTAGHLTREVLTRAGNGYPETYAELAGIYARSPDNQRAQALLDAHWRAALEAGTGFEQAMAAIARGWPR